MVTNDWCIAPTTYNNLDSYVEINKQNWRKIVNIFLSMGFDICFGCPKNRLGSFEYPQHVFWLRNKKIDF